MPGMMWTALLNSPQPLTAGTALTNSTTATDISVAPQLTIPANFSNIGTALSFRAWGVFSSAASTPGTLTLGVYYGGVAGVALTTAGAITPTVSAANWPWRMEGDIDIWSTGATGTANTEGLLYLGTSLTAVTPFAMPATAQATVTVDTTAAKTLTVGATWGTANASNSITLRGFKVFSDGL